MVYRENPEEPEPDRSVLVVALSGHVYGLDRATGKIRWHNRLTGGGYGEVFIAVGYGVVVASAAGERIFCLDYLTGETRWTQWTQHPGRATILIEADQIVCAKGGYLDCFTPKGERVWIQLLEGAGTGRIALGYPGNVAQADDMGDR